MSGVFEGLRVYDFSQGIAGPMASGLLAQFGADVVKVEGPVHLVTPQVSYAHGILGGAAIAASVYERRRSGLGQSVVVTGLHAAAAARSGGALRSPNLVRMGAGPGARGGSPNYRLYQCG